MKHLFTIFLLLIITSGVWGQWNSNTAQNTQVADTTGESAVTKMALCPDGSTYYGWFDNRGGSYAVYLQKLSPLGIKQFPAQGLLISNNPQSSSLVDWDLIADDSNNCILVFTDTRNGSSINPFAYKISPAGTFLWGANGISLADTTTVYQANPKVVKTTNGDFVVSWIYASTPRKVALQRLSPSGVKMWGTPAKYLGSGTTEIFDWPWPVASDSGSVILLWSGYTGSFISPSNYKLYTQKFNSSGTRVWNSSQDTVYSLGRVSGFYTPRIYPDGNGGAIYAWQDDRFSTNTSNCYVHRKSSTGEWLFPINGSAAALNHPSTRLRFTPSAVVMPSTQETYVFWQEKNSTQTLIGIYGQKFSSTGTRLWADTGIAVKEMNTYSVVNYDAFTKDSNVYIAYLETQGGTNTFAKAVKLTRTGSFVWPGSILTPGSLTSNKLKLVSVLNNNKMLILAWIDGRIDNGVYAQNVNNDGTFGPATGIYNNGNILPEKFELKQNYPNPFNPQTLIEFYIPESGFVSLELYNVLGQKVASLVNGNFAAGSYFYKLNSASLSSGIYFYKITVTGKTNEFFDIKKMTLIK